MARVSPRQQVLSFGIVGVLNTVIDFVILNILKIVFSVPIIPANIVSTTCAMAFSFFANKRVVFASDGKNKKREVALFIAGTLFGLYVIQNMIILFMTEAEWLGDFTYTIVEITRLDAVFSRDFAISNAAKLVATVFSMVWNFYFYRHVVFRVTEKKS